MYWARIVLLVGLVQAELIQVDFQVLYDNGSPDSKIFIRFNESKEYDFGHDGYWSHESVPQKGLTISVDFEDVNKEMQYVTFRNSDEDGLKINQFWMTIQTNPVQHYESDAYLIMGKKIDNPGYSPIDFPVHLVPDGQIRLLDGDSRLDGRVEIFHNNEWGTICGNSFGTAEASVVCRQRRFVGYELYWTEAYFGAGTGQIWLDQLSCNGNETSVSQCSFRDNTWGRNNCDHQQDASVRCHCPEAPGYIAFAHIGEKGGDCSSSDECVADCKEQSDFDCVAFDIFHFDQCCLWHEMSSMDQWEGMCTYINESYYTDCDMEYEGYTLYGNIQPDSDGGECMDETNSSACQHRCHLDDNCGGFSFLSADEQCCTWKHEEWIVLQMWIGSCTYLKEPTQSTQCPAVLNYEAQGNVFANESYVDCQDTSGRLHEGDSFFDCLVRCEQDVVCVSFRYFDDTETCCNWEERPPYSGECIYFKNGTGIETYNCSIEVSGFTVDHVQNFDGIYLLDTEMFNNHSIYRKVEDGMLIYFDNAESDTLFSSFWTFGYKLGARPIHILGHSNNLEGQYLSNELIWYHNDQDIIPNIRINCQPEYPVCDGFAECCRLTGICSENEGYCSSHSQCKDDLLCGFGNCNAGQTDLLALQDDPHNSKHLHMLQTQDYEARCCTKEEDFKCPNVTDFETYTNMGLPMKGCLDLREECNFIEDGNQTFGDAFTWLDGTCCVYHSRLVLKVDSLTVTPGWCTFIRILEVKPTEGGPTTDWVLILAIAIPGVAVLACVIIFYLAFGGKRSKNLPVSSDPLYATLSTDGRPRFLDYDQFHDIKILARGSFGIAYTATLLINSKREIPVICKVPIGDPGEQEMNEIRVLTKLYKDPHPNVLRLVGLCANFQLQLDSNLPCHKSANIFDLHEESLHSYISSIRSLQMTEMYRFALQMTEGIAHLHTNNILHRDISLGNYVLSADNEIVLIDFGLAQFISEDDPVYIHQPDDIVQWRICPPEVVLQHKTTKQSTIWMLGLAFWSLITSQTAFEDVSDEVELIDLLVKTMIMKGEEIPLIFPPDTPTEFAVLVKQCCAFDPKLRPSDTEIIRRLRKIMNQSSGCSECMTFNEGKKGRGVSGLAEEKHMYQEVDTGKKMQNGQDEGAKKNANYNGTVHEINKEHNKKYKHLKKVELGVEVKTKQNVELATVREYV